jgi:hypothetical protein
VAAPQTRAARRAVGTRRLQHQVEAAAEDAGFQGACGRVLSAQQPETEASSAPTVLGGQSQGTTGAAQRHDALGLQALRPRMRGWRPARGSPDRGPRGGAALVLVVLPGHGAGAGQTGTRARLSSQSGTRRRRRRPRSAGTTASRGNCGLAGVAPLAVRDSRQAPSPCPPSPSPL